MCSNPRDTACLSKAMCKSKPDSNAYRIDTKSGKRSEIAARLSWQTACDLGFCGTLTERERLMGAASKR